jgi:hypothetical protein
MANGAHINVAGEFKTTAAANIALAGNGTLTAGSLNLAGNLNAAVGLNVTGAASLGGDLTVGGAASLGGNLTVGGKATFSGTLTNTAVAIFTFNGPTTVTNKLTAGAALTIAGTGAVELSVIPDTITGSNIIEVSNSGGVTLKGGINVGTVAGGLTIATGGKVVLSDSKVITSAAAGTVTGGHWALGALVGTATAKGDIIFTSDGIKGAAAGATLSLDTSSIAVGLTDVNNIGATFDAVDIYLKDGATSVVTVQSGATGTNATTLTLVNGAKISGLTGAGTTSAGVDVTAIAGAAGGATGGIANIIAVTGTASNSAPGNYLGIKGGSANGKITATASGGAKKYDIKIASIASATGA